MFRRRFKLNHKHQVNGIGPTVTEKIIGVGGWAK